LINCSIVNDLLYSGIDFVNSLSIFLSNVIETTIFLSLVLPISIETSPNQKRNIVCLNPQTKNVLPH